MAHENPIEFRRASQMRTSRIAQPSESVPPPKSLDLQRDQALTITWDDDSISTYPIAYLRKMSPSADARALREEIKSNPLTVLPSGENDQPLTVENAELVGNYAIRLIFSDGHDTGIYSWRYLKTIDPAHGEVDPDELLGL